MSGDDKGMKKEEEQQTFSNRARSPQWGCQTATEGRYLLLAAKFDYDRHGTQGSLGKIGERLKACAWSLG